MLTENTNTPKVTPGLCFNGIDGSTGHYLLPPLSPREVATLASGDLLDPEQIEELRRGWNGAKEPHFAPVAGVDVQDLSQAGWGVIFAPDVSEAEKECLLPLLLLREQQAGCRYKEFSEEKAYRRGDTKYSFLGRSGAGPGPVNPKNVPYYLLIVGDPTSIPFSFQYQLDVQHAVGRLHFDSPEQYAAYAHSVVEVEKGAAQRPRQVSLFGVRNRADRATQLSADHLVRPLKDSLQRAEPNWKIRCFLADESKKADLAKLLGGKETPALLVTASHGMGFPAGDPRQLAHQGALLCQDWPGPLKHKGLIPEDFYFAGKDVPDDAKLQGLIAFFFACYGGGTPQSDDFAHITHGPQSDIAPFPFVAALPKRLLGHPKGGALAVIAHVERAWTYSFLWQRAGEQLGVFESAIVELLNGRRVGSAMEYFGSRYAELSSDLTEELKDRKARRSRPESETVAEDEVLAGMWTANNDARSYVVLGDPAVQVT
jgi:hypothetical protein